MGKKQAASSAHYCQDETCLDTNEAKINLVTFKAEAALKNRHCYDH